MAGHQPALILDPHRLLPTEPASGKTLRDRTRRAATVSDGRASQVVPLAAGSLSEVVPQVRAELVPNLGADADAGTIVVGQGQRLSKQ